VAPPPLFAVVVLSKGPNGRRLTSNLSSRPLAVAAVVRYGLSLVFSVVASHAPCFHKTCAAAGGLKIVGRNPGLALC
jgi:hypothetical protein